MRTGAYWLTNSINSKKKKHFYWTVVSLLKRFHNRRINTRFNKCWTVYWPKKDNSHTQDLNNKQNSFWLVKTKSSLFFIYFSLLQLFFPSSSVTFQTPEPGCSGRGEGGISVWRHWENTSHCHGSQVFTPATQNTSAGFCLSLTNISTQYFPKALFPDQIPPRSAGAQSGEPYCYSLFTRSQDAIRLQTLHHMWFKIDSFIFSSQ